MQDEAAKDAETRRNEQMAWQLIREEQRKRASGSALEAYKYQTCSQSSVEPQTAPPQGADTFQDAANLLRAGLKVLFNSMRSALMECADFILCCTAVQCSFFASGDVVKNGAEAGLGMEGIFFFLGRAHKALT